MTVGEFSNKRLDYLIDVVSHEHFTEAEADELTALLSNHPAARQVYIRRMNLLGDLTALSRRSMGGPELVSPQLVVRGKPTAPSTDIRRQRWLPYALAAILIAVSTAYMGTLLTQNRDPAIVDSGLPGTSSQLAEKATQLDSGVATLKSCSGWWSGAGMSAEIGETISVGQWLHLEKGQAELQFRNGVLLTIGGGSEVEIESSETVRLYRGTVSAVVPENAIGFTVATALADIVDLGTEFSVSVQDKQLVDVEVHSGLARVEGNGRANETRLVEAGEAIRVDPMAQDYFSSTPRAALKHSTAKENGSLFIAYQTRQGTVGTQSYQGKLGHDFDVTRAIEITRLGVFDSGSDGLNREITCELWRRDTAGGADRAERLVRLTFAEGDPGELIESNRFLPLDVPLRLEPGAYSIVAAGYGIREPNGNDHDGGWQRHLKARTDGDGLISFVGSSRFELDEQAQPDGSYGWESNADAFPGFLDQRFVDRYSAGTFEFRAAGRSVEPNK